MSINIFGEINFFIILAIACIPAVMCGVMEKPIKYYGFFITLLFIVLALYQKKSAIIYLIIYCAWQILQITVYQNISNKSADRRGDNVSKEAVKKVQKKSRPLLWLFLFLSMLPLILFKVFQLFEITVFTVLGLSYMTFKALQMLLEIYDGLIKEISIMETLYFLLFFPCLESGPIDRSRRFHQDYTEVKSRSEYLECMGTGIFKLLLGAVYKFVFASIFFRIRFNFGTGSEWYTVPVNMYSYGFYLFFDFAGYSLMAIGTSYLFGIRTPENFNKPFISTDMLDFWNRWHMSLSYWLRDYLFSRFVMASMKGRWFKNKLTGPVIGLMINMTVMGLWHGLAWNFIIYGMYHGVLLAATEIYQKKFKFHKRHKKQRGYKMCSWFITFNLVMFGFYIFSGELF